MANDLKEATEMLHVLKQLAFVVNYEEHLAGLDKAIAVQTEILARKSTIGLYTRIVEGAIEIQQEAK